MITMMMLLMVVVMMRMIRNDNGCDTADNKNIIIVMADDCD